MTLSAGELLLVETIIGVNDPKNGSATNNSLIMDGIESDPNAISLWFDEIPLLELDKLSYVLTTIEVHNYLSILDCQSWLANLFEKFSLSTIPSVLGFTVEELVKKTRIFDQNLFVYGFRDSLPRYSLRGLVYEIHFRQIWPLLKEIITLTVCDGILSELTANRLLLEFGGLENKKRWESLGISAAPTGAEISSILN